MGRFIFGFILGFVVSIAITSSYLKYYSDKADDFEFKYKVLKNIDPVREVMLDGVYVEWRVYRDVHGPIDWNCYDIKYYEQRDSI